MSDKSLKLPLREGVSVLLVVSNLRRQVATFRKKVILEKLEREEEKGAGGRRKRGGEGKKWCGRKEERERKTREGKKEKGRG